MALTDGILSYYKFDGDYTDATGNGHDVSTYTSTTLGTEYGKINEGVNSVQTSPYTSMEIPYADAFGTPDGFSISLWIKATLVSGETQGFWSYGQYESTYHWCITLSFNSDGTANCNVYPTDGTSTGYIEFSSNTVVADSTWHHLVYTFVTGGAQNIYIDGSSDYSGTNSLSTIADNGYPLYMAFDGDVEFDGPAHHLNGDMDEVGFWNRALSSTEVSTLYNGGAGLQYPFSTPPSALSVSVNDSISVAEFPFVSDDSSNYFDVYDIDEVPYNNYAFIEQSSNRSIARASNGDLYVVYNGYNPTIEYYSIRISRSTDAGNTWEQYELYSYADGSSYTPKIAIDSNDKIWVVWEGYGAENNPSYKNIHLIYGTWGSWSSKVDITDSSTENFVPGIAIDENDDIHLVWYGYDSSVVNSGELQIRYVEVSNDGTVGTITPLTDQASDQLDPAIAVDSNGDLHVVWYGLWGGSGTTADSIQYIKQTSGSWGSAEIVSSYSSPAQGLFQPAITIDNDGNPHVIYNNYTSSQYEHTWKTTSWQTPEIVESDVANFYAGIYYYSCISCDAEGTLHMVYVKGPITSSTDPFYIRYVRKPSGGSLSSPTTINNSDFNPQFAYFQQEPTLMWAMFPKINGISTNIPATGAVSVWIDTHGDILNDAANVVGYFTQDYSLLGSLSVYDTTTLSEFSDINESSIPSLMLEIDGSGSPPNTGLRYGLKIID